MFVAIDIDRLAIDELHYEVGQPVIRQPAIQQSSDIWVIERSQRLPLMTEPPQDVLVIHPAPDDLYGNIPLESIIIALGLVDGAHTSVAEFFADAIRADKRADEGIEVCLVKRFEGGRLAIGVVEELVAGVVIRREQLRHLVPQLSISAAILAKIRRALRRIKVEGGVK